MGNRFGPPTDSRPESAEQVILFFAIVVNALGADEAARWFETAYGAHQQVVAAEEARTVHFGFAGHLDGKTEAYRQPSPPVVAAFEATKALHEVTRQDAAADVDVFFDSALRACARNAGQPDSTPVAAGASP
ncbi:hypothetical protein ACWDZ4_34445 [Streptomyces sp. NPDC003016]